MIAFHTLVLWLSFFNASFTSSLEIPAYQQFYLGGGHTFSFKATAKNTGSVPVTILLYLPNNAEKELTILEPGQEAKAEAPDGATMVFRNTTGKDARVKVKADDRAFSLPMYYKTEKEYRKP
jgi:hypothetical protein